VIFALAGLTLLIDSVSGLNQKVPASLTLIVAFLTLIVFVAVAGTVGALVFMNWRRTSRDEETGKRAAKKAAGKRPVAEKKKTGGSYAGRRAHQDAGDEEELQDGYSDDIEEEEFVVFPQHRAAAEKAAPFVVAGQVKTRSQRIPRHEVDYEEELQNDDDFVEDLFNIEEDMDYGYYDSVNDQEEFAGDMEDEPDDDRETNRLKAKCDEQARVIEQLLMQVQGNQQNNLATNFIVCLGEAFTYIEQNGYYELPKKKSASGQELVYVHSSKLYEFIMQSVENATKDDIFGILKDLGIIDPPKSGYDTPYQGVRVLRVYRTQYNAFLKGMSVNAAV
jgi:hypothetical protein